MEKKENEIWPLSVTFPEGGRIHIRNNFVDKVHILSTIRWNADSLLSS